MADLPFLYQRWCGWKIVCALRALGYEVERDPIPALLLAGSIPMRRGDNRVQLHCEPRLVWNKRPLHGLSVQRGEASPDFVLTVESPAGVLAYVLDPTLDHSRESRQSKSKYLTRLRVLRYVSVGGTRWQAGPERAWAAAPLNDAICLADDWRGSTGTVPMNPLNFHEAPIRAWIQDLTSLTERELAP